MKWLPIIIVPILLASCQQSKQADSLQTRAPTESNIVASPNDVRVHEIFVQLFPRDGYLHVKEYNITSLKDPDSLADQVLDMRSKVSALAYSESEYGFEHFDAKEESFFEDRGLLTGEYHLKTDLTNLKELIDDSFSKILRRPVELTITDENITLVFGDQGIRVADNNSTGVFGNRDENLIRMSFPNGSRKYEAVFTMLYDDDESSTLIENFGDDVHAEKDPGK